MRDKVLRYLSRQSNYEEFGELIDSPGWEFVNSLNIPALDKFICLALAQSSSRTDELKREAGLSKSKGHSLIRRYWRRFSIARLIKVPRYKALYKEQLDQEWKINESLGYKSLAEKCLPYECKEDVEAFYSKGKLPTERLKSRARLFVLGLFFDDLINEIKHENKGEM